MRLVPGPLFDRLGVRELRSLAETLRSERLGGMLLVVSATLAVGWANSPWGAGYDALRGVVVGPAALHLDLTLEEWASDGLLAIFFFVVGLELKREIVVGELRRPATAIVPVLAAVGGMLAPAAIYLAINLTAPDGDPRGWAVPTATDIAFAVAVLAVVGRGLPYALRAFLLTLAVVDDLLAIVVIAVFYSRGVLPGWIAASVLVVGAVWWLLRRGTASPWLLVPLGLLAWWFMHRSGVHATIAGVLLGFAVPATSPDPRVPSLVERFEHRWRPVSAGVAVPVFAFLAAGVSLRAGVLRDAVADPAAIAVAAGLVLGKPLGIVGTTALVSRSRRAGLASGLSWWDVVGVGVLAGIGFTLSLLVAELAFGGGTARDEHVTVAILIASLVAAGLGSAVLLARGRHYRRMSA